MIAATCSAKSPVCAVACGLTAARCKPGSTLAWVSCCAACWRAAASCQASTYKTTALITDSAGVPIVVISNDGAAAITQRIAMTKAQAVLKYKMSSGEVLAKLGTDAALAAEIKANPLIETARPGAYPIMAGSEMVGIISVSGAPGGEKDEVCSKAGIAKIQDRVK